MKNWMKACAFLAVAAAVGAAQAGVVAYNSFSTIGDPGATGYRGYGNVSYEYQIGNHEVTYLQWNQMISAINNDPSIPMFENTGGIEENRWVDQVGNGNYNLGQYAPVVNVSLVEATYYCNWLTSGNPYEGAYYIDGEDYPRVNRQAAVEKYGYNNVYVLPTENEWFKAAYYRSTPYNQGGDYFAAGTWSEYADGGPGDYRGTLEYPIKKVEYEVDAEGKPIDVHLWYDGWNYETENIRNALYGEREQNGTYNMMGNVYEWVELPNNDWTIVVRGGTGMKDYSYMRNSSRDTHFFPWESDYDVGFRVAKVIPEPMTIGLAMIGGCVAWFARLKQK